MTDLNDFFKLMAEGKKDTPSARAKKIEEQVKESVKTDLGSLFAELSALKNKKEELIQQNPELVVEEVIQEVAPLSTPIGHVPAEQQVEPQSNPALDMVEIGKYLTTTAPKEEGDNPLSEYSIINKKIKFLEQWIGKIQNTGPGSGEVNFRYLDDVNRGTMNPGNDNWVLEYDATTKKVQFTENVGALKTFLFNTAGPDAALIPGQLGWNPDEDCLDIRHADGSTLQAGLEQHMQVYNGTDSTLANGTVVRFAGVNGDGDETPIVAPHIANGTIPPLYTVGILTNSIPNGEIGRATTYGKVRNINTTGSDVGETWVTGDILYVSPTNAGKCTKVKPTAPNIVVVVAAVLKVGTTDGILLVRPTIFPRLHYGTFVDKTNQTATLINTPYAVKYNTTDVANGHRRDNVDTSKIIAEVSGYYNYKFSIQLVSSNSSAKEVWIWFRKNGVDIPDSASRVTIVGNSVYSVASWDVSVSMDVNDYFQIMWAVSDTAVSITAPAATAFCPAIPSVILNVTEAAL